MKNYQYVPMECNYSLPLDSDIEPINGLRAIKVKYISIDSSGYVSGIVGIGHRDDGEPFLTSVLEADFIDISIDYTLTTPERT